ncbi:MAG: hypothetical protein ABSF00_02865 [Candidatus Bathyarchaeia archaeon]|jgi:hypothetical membrane protein
MDKGIMVAGVLLLLAGLTGTVKHVDTEWIFLLLGGLTLTVVGARRK